ncbi:hypothetical protein FA15DRAFT_20681 [Coprinopsis marcescibilis]|uniref:Chromo domain-containing protein n=1 Tax=Coprinopsis marcescibilis TaxID=230819 RepID=A0A5C3LCR7_COPMA|nr:hypothetical protein FA15DRAFT_20681 [Coprinopsis marcescibilis]
MGGEEESDAQAFTVEVILAAKVGYDEQEKPAKTKRGKKTKKPELRWYYQVKWAGYPVEESTWEPEGNLSGCEKLKASFWAAIGYDHEDYGPDDEPLVPPKKWIKAEKKKFAKEWEKTHPRETVRLAAISLSRTRNLKPSSSL